LLDRDQVRLGFTAITSPIKGVAGLNLVDAGNVVTPSDSRGLVVVTQIEPIAVIFTIPQVELPQVQLDQQSAGAAGLTVEVWSQTGAHKLDTGTLRNWLRRSPHSHVPAVRGSGWKPPGG
jgi:multidrug efflux system membrane fusion protein